MSDLFNGAGPAAPLPTPEEQLTARSAAWFAERHLDLADLIAKHDPHRPLPWVVDPLVIRGHLAILAGKGGAGKTWVLHEAADAVQRDLVKAGLRGRNGIALIIDAEMGQFLTVDRFAKQNYATSIEVVDAHGIDLRTPEGRAHIEYAVRWIGPDFLGLDSLRALTPSAKENDSDDMGPVVTWLRGLCRETGAAGLLVHHAGWKEDRTRGSSVIKDQADAVWYMTSPDEDGVAKLSCRGADLKAPRWCRPPEDIWVALRPEGGLVSVDEPQPTEDRASELRINLLGLLPEDDEGELPTIRDLAETLGSKSRVENAIRQLRKDGLVGQGRKGRGYYRIPRTEAPI